MSSCLGLYIEENLIKYAKVTKDHDMLKIDSFGIKFYDKIGETINQIIAETFSYKIPISVNLSEEAYQYFYFFNLLNKNDLKKAVETEFDSYCFDKGYNRNALETRYALVPDIQDKEKIKAIYISTNKTEINKRTQEFEENPIANITSLPMCIANVAEIKSKENIIIANLEAKTTVTTILDDKIYNIDKLEDGMQAVLSSINAKENSYAKAYEICKNTTIYTMEGKELLPEEENIYLEDIMPTLYNIVQGIKNIMDSSLSKIDKVYLTGTGCSINNIDLYFQEYLKDVKCEILKPYFVPNTVKINIKDYIEVNSAIALAMQGIGYGIKNINFKKPGLTDNLPDWLKLDIGSKKGKTKEKAEGKEKLKSKGKFNFDFSLDLKSALDRTERWLVRTITGILMFVVIYSIITVFLNSQIEQKSEEINEFESDTKSQIELVGRDIQTLNNKTTNYQKMTENLKNYNDAVEKSNKIKNIIPNLLTNIMYSIPEGVTITSIENTTNTHVVIYAQSEKYELLGYFKANIINDGILSPSTVISTSGVKQDGTVKIVIEGDLP